MICVIALKLWELVLYDHSVAFLLTLFQALDNNWFVFMAISTYLGTCATQRTRTSSVWSVLIAEWHINNLVYQLAWCDFFHWELVYSWVDNGALGLEMLSAPRQHSACLLASWFFPPFPCQLLTGLKSLLYLGDLFLRLNQLFEGHPSVKYFTCEVLLSWPYQL